MEAGILLDCFYQKPGGNLQGYVDTGGFQNLGWRLEIYYEAVKQVVKLAVVLNIVKKIMF